MYTSTCVGELFDFLAVCLFFLSSSFSFFFVETLQYNFENHPPPGPYFTQALK